MSGYSKIFLCGLVVGMIGGLDGCGGSIQWNLGGRAPNFTLADTEGQATELARFKGRQPVVLVFYSTSG